MLEILQRPPATPNDSPPLLFVHGAWHGAWCWDLGFMEYLADRGYDCHAVSLRGHAGSPIDGSLRWNRWKGYVEDVAEAVESLPVSPILVGHSMGGYTVQKYLESHTAPGAVLLASGGAGWPSVAAPRTEGIHDDRTYSCRCPASSSRFRQRSSSSMRSGQWVCPGPGQREVARAREITSMFGERNAAPFMDMVEAFKIVDVFERNGKPIEAEVQIFTLGEDFAIVSWPGEVFVELGLYLKERSPYPYTMVIELANGSEDYIPDRKAFLEGNYEPVSARCAPGSGEILVSNTVKELMTGSGVVFSDRGVYDLKGIPDQWRVFAVVDDPELN